jgi:hypothetical protein
MYYCAEEVGLDAQQLKVTLEQGRTQYLRIAYETDGSIIGYLARAISRFVSTEWKPQYGSLLSDRLGELNAQISLLFNRGMHDSVCKAIFEEMRQFYSGVGQNLPGKVQLTKKLAHAPVESNGAGILVIEDDEAPVYYYTAGMPKQPQVPPPSQVMAVVTRIPSRAIRRYWTLLSERFPQLAANMPRKVQEREILRTHIGDCLAQLPRSLQHVDRIERNRKFAAWSGKWDKQHGVRKRMDNDPKRRRSIPQSMEAEIDIVVREDVLALEAMSDGFDVEFALESGYERLRNCIHRQGVQIESFVVTSVKRAPVQQRWELLKPFTHGMAYGYTEWVATKIVLDGYQFNSIFGRALPPQFASVIRQRALHRFEQCSQDALLIRGFVFYYEAMMMRCVRKSPLLARKVQF